MGLYPRVHSLCVPLSFETGQQTTNDIRYRSRVQIIGVKAVVTKALANTDAGTVAIKNAAGTTLATVTIALSSVIGTEATIAIPAGTFVAKDSFLRLVPAKTTVGGEINFFVEYQTVGK